MTINASTAIRERISAADIANKYGFTPNNAGFIRCPFHGDTNRSLKLYPGSRGWHCFGCHMGGSVIDFVMAIDHVDFNTAVETIDSAFSLGLVQKNKSNKPSELSHELQLIELAKDIYNAEKSRLDAEYEDTETNYYLMLAAKEQFAPKMADDPMNETYKKASELVDTLGQRLQDLEMERRCFIRDGRENARLAAERQLGI